jgi:hypothetical protein
MLLLFGVRIDIGIHSAQLSPTKGREILREAAQIFLASLLIMIVRPVLGQTWLEAGTGAAAATFPSYSANIGYSYISTWYSSEYSQRPAFIFRKVVMGSVPRTIAS